ncbi:DUF481 domain-containing protein [Sulfurimonas sp. SAG-AH-194-C21]|nr:DUF481 domain-containing protein [Sulfurimonas sp. SAG-AH-194-C21]MDF1883189.1 DUF481 domain-containing protein [Sulfurimonas sp. SAG-AH-194-C21]
MKILLLISLFFLSLNAGDIDSNNTAQIQEIEIPSEEVIVVEDTSGLSDDEIRLKATQSDAQEDKKVPVSEVVKALDYSGNVNLSEIQQDFSQLSPKPIKYDWVKTKSGEWFKGEIKALYDDRLEFDSDEVGLHSFKFDDVVWIKSYNIISVNIENLATFPGILRLKGEKLTIIQGENKYEFARKDIVSFAPDGEYERNFWSGKATLNFDIRTGNTNQYDYSAKINILRRSSVSRLSLDYLGRITDKDGSEISNNHRLNQKYDRYLTRNFFWTPVFSELYSDKYINIEKQVTAGIGVGYTLVNNKKVKWSFSGGPAFVYTKYETVAIGNKIEDFSPALELSTKYENELNSIMDLIYDYKLTSTNKAAGTYKHHMLLTLENELTSWLDLDITGVWDYILDPKETAQKIVPKQNDFQLLFGLGMEF